MLTRKCVDLTWYLVIALLATVIGTMGVSAGDGAVSVLPQSATPQPIAGSMNVERHIEPATFGPGQEVNVRLELTGNEVDGCWGIPSRPVDMFIVFDISTSAGIGPGSNWERTVNLAQSLVDYMSRPVYRSARGSAEYSQIALISSQVVTTGIKPFLLQPLTADYNLLHTQVVSLVPSGDTDVAAGILMAVSALSGDSDHAKAILLMLHDNTALDKSTRDAIEKADASSIKVYLVANGLNIPDEKKITMEMAKDVVPRDRVYLDPEAADLYKLFIDSTEGDTDLAAASIQISENFSPAGVVRVFEVNGPNGRAETDRVVWDVADIPAGESIDLSYGFRVSDSAPGDINISGDFAWLDCNGYPQGSTVALSVQPKAETETPSSTPQEVTTQETPGTTSATPDVAGTPVAVVTPSVPSRPGGMFGPLWGAFVSLPDWLQWLLLGFLLLAILAFLWWLLTRGKKETRPHKVVKPLKRLDGEVHSPGGEKKPRPRGRDVESEWREKELVKDAQGRELTLWIRPRVDTVENALSGKRNVKLVVRADEDEREVGRAEMVLRWERKFDPLTGETSRWRQVRLDMLEVSKNARRRGIEGVLLRRVEALARQHKAQEVYVKSAPEGIQKTLVHAGYQKQEEGGYMKRLPSETSTRK